MGPPPYIRHLQTFCRHNNVILGTKCMRDTHESDIKVLLKIFLVCVIQDQPPGNQMRMVVFDNFAHCHV